MMVMKLEVFFLALHSIKHSIKSGTMILYSKHKKMGYRKLIKSFEAFFDK